DDYYDTEGDVLYLKKLLNEDPSLNLPLVKTKDLKQVDATMTKPSTEEPPELKLKELPSDLEYAFLEGTNKSRLTHKTKKILHSLALIERFPTDVCLLVYVMLQARSKGAENLAADHLSRLKNPHQDELKNKEITETFPLKNLGMIAFRGDSSTPWIAPDLEASRARGFIHRPLEL
nr:reverse transcriptase domain-containing protein [Tanacetum cinerariifolium]